MELVRYFLTEARKATIAFASAAVGTGVGAFQIAFQDGTVTQVEWEQIVGSAVVVGLVAAYAVFQTKNKGA